MGRGSGCKGGMQTVVEHSNYCPLCKNILFLRIENIVGHWTKKGNVVYCDLKNRIKRKKVNSQEWDKVRTAEYTRCYPSRYREEQNLNKGE